MPTLISKYLYSAKTRDETPEEKARVDITENIFVGLEDFFHVDVDKIIEGIDMLFHKTFNFEKSRQQFPFIL